MRLKLMLAGAVLPLMLWTVLPLASQGATPGDRAAAIQDKIDAKQQHLAGKRARSRVLTTDVTRYSRRIEALRVKSRFVV